MRKQCFVNYHLLSERFLRLVPVLLLLLTVGFMMACNREKSQLQEPAAPGEHSPSKPVQEDVKETPPDFSSAIEFVAQKAIPAVVHIEVTERQEVVNPSLPFENDPFFRFFFGVPNIPRKYQRELKGLGTGMIIDPQGHILTNNHVVGGANKIKVLLASGDEYPAKIVGTDPKTDLAIIQISARNPLPHLTFGDSDKINVGKWVVAIGHPQGLDQTVTQGIISAKHRTGIMDPSTYQDFLQTDAAINPGNSGGPLLNLQGAVIGVNAAIVSQSGGFEGIGFAIPSNMALHVATQLVKQGKVERGWLGVSIGDLTPEKALSLNIGRTKGALIVEVLKDGPGERAGLKKDDVVIAYQGKEINDGSSLRNEVTESPIGQRSKLTVVRGGETKEIEVQIGNLDDERKILSSSVTDRLGGEVRPVSSQDAEQYDISPEQGVVVTWLDPKGALGQAGFEVKDIILEVNGQAITDMDFFAGLVAALKPNQKIVVLALDHRSGTVGTVEVVVQ
jgi:serine protease Do